MYMDINLEKHIELLLVLVEYGWIVVTGRKLCVIYLSVDIYIHVCYMDRFVMCVFLRGGGVLLSLCFVVTTATPTNR